MKTFWKFFALGLVIGVLFGLIAKANAAEPVSFSPASYCPTYCTGITTSDPQVTIDYIMDGEVGLSVNQVVYRNATALQSAQLLGTVSQDSVTTVTLWQLSNVPYASADGRVVFLSLTYQRTQTKINSGRVHATRVSYTDLGGSIQF